jgi:6-phosphogluconolactonase (cycloisomerase 2 family)
VRYSHRWLIAVVCCGVCALAGCTNKGVVSSKTPPVTPTAKKVFAYTGNQGASLSGFSVNTSTGALTALTGFPLAVGTNPIAVAADPQSRFLFVGDIAASKLHVFSINSSTGALSEIGTSPYATVDEPVAIVIDPSGTHVYVASQGSNFVGGFSLSSTGALTPIGGSPFATSGTQNFGDDVVINAAGTFVYAQDTVNIYVYSVNASSGALTRVQTIAGPSMGGGIALDPAGSYLYAVGSSTNSILVYSINSPTGLLTRTGSSPMAEQAGAYTISISPNGQFAYTIENNNYLVSYAVENGKFTARGNVYAQVYGERIGVDPSGSYVYVPQACSNCASAAYNVVNEFSIGGTGALTKMAGSPVAAGTTPWGIAFATQ